MLAILILAAGRATRMGGEDKLLQVVQGAPLLVTMARRALGTGCPTWVALATDRPARGAALDGLDLTPVTVRDAALGMGHSIAAGVAALPASVDAVMILPADMPEITGADLMTLRTTWQDAAPDTVLRATSGDGTAGHPVVFPATCFAGLKALVGDQGARSVIARHTGPYREIPLPARHALVDLDTPQDWARWRARHR